MIWLLAEIHWDPSMAAGREEEVEKQSALLVRQLLGSESNTAQATRKEDDEVRPNPAGRSIWPVVGCW